MKHYQEEIGKLLRRLGLNSSYVGFHYLTYAIALAINDPTLLTYICKGLYVELAINFRTSLNCVERNIRTVKDVIWKYGDKELLQDIFGAMVENDKAPTNAVFIDYLVEYIRELN